MPPDASTSTHSALDERKPSQGKRILKMAVQVLIVAGLAGAGWWYYAQSKVPEQTVGDTVPVTSGEIRETAEATGHIEPHIQVEVKSRASGEVIEVLIEEGDTVEAGQVLFRLDARDSERDLEDARVTLRRVNAEAAQARANRTVAQAQASDAEATRAVSARGAERGLVSSEADRSTETAAAVARATVSLRSAAVQASSAAQAAARLAVQDAEQRLTEMEITAPVSGTVLSVTIERGAIVASAISNVSGGTALATLADLSDLRVIGAIDEAQIGQVEAEQEVEIRVDAYPEQVFSGRVARVAPLGVEESNVVTFDVEIIIEDENASLLRSGMSADLTIITGRQEGILVPLTAVRSEDGRRFVVLASGESRQIRTGSTDGRQLVVLRGLTEGDEVSTANTAAAAPERGERERPANLIPGTGGRGGGGGGGGRR